MSRRLGTVYEWDVQLMHGEGTTVRVRQTIAAVLLGLAATVVSAAPVSADAAGTCWFRPDMGTTALMGLRLSSPGVYTGTIYFGGGPTCDFSAYHGHAVTTFHGTLNGVDKSGATFTYDCGSGADFCVPISAVGWNGLKCDVVYNYETWVTVTGWYQATSTSPRVDIAPLTGPHKQRTSYHPSICN